MAVGLGKTLLLLLLTLPLLFGGVCSVSAPSSPARIVNGFFSNAFSVLMKWVLSLRATTKTAITGRPLMKFEGGYNVETVFDGSKLGIEPHSVEILPDGDLLILDSVNNNLYKISSSLSLYSRPRLITGSADGYGGHVDGRLRDARMNHPKGLTVDDRGNVYIADIDNMAIRKISDAGVTTIAGGKRSRGGGGGHVDGPSEVAKFSNDFDVVYLGSSCSLLVIDRGNKAIREIQLHFDDCAYQYGSSFPHGAAMLLSAGFFGYMLALLQRRVGRIMFPQDDEEIRKESISLSPYQKPLKSTNLPPLIPNENELEKQESFLGSLGRLIAQTGESAAELFGGLFPVFKKKQRQVNWEQRKYDADTWPVQDSFVIPDEDEPPPSLETRAPTPKKTYAFMSKDSVKMQQLKQSRAFYSGWDAEFQKQQPKKYHQQRLPVPRTYYEQSHEKTEFGAVQEQEKPRMMKPLEHGQNPAGDHENIRSRFGYSQGR